MNPLVYSPLPNAQMRELHRLLVLLSRAETLLDYSETAEQRRSSVNRLMRLRRGGCEAVARALSWCLLDVQDCRDGRISKRSTSHKRKAISRADRWVSCWLLCGSGSSDGSLFTHLRDALDAEPVLPGRPNLPAGMPRGLPPRPAHGQGS